MAPTGPLLDTAACSPKGGTERRRRPRVRLTLDGVTPVWLSGEGFRGRGLARNISEGGVLVQVDQPPPIGSRVEVTFEPVESSRQASESLTLRGEVRHQVAWTFTQDGERQTLRAVGIRFLETRACREAATSWIFRTGHAVH